MSVITWWNDHGNPGSFVNMQPGNNCQSRSGYINEIRYSRHRRFPLVLFPARHFNPTLNGIPVDPVNKAMGEVNNQ